MLYQMSVLFGWPLFLQRFAKRLGFVLYRFFYMTIQHVNWQINGTAEKIRESRRPENYDRCAQVLDIVSFNQFDNVQHGSIEDYILSHNRFENPKYIFDNDHISLITINEENAIFGAAKQKGRHLWKLDYCSFMRKTEVLNSNQLILVPLNHFHRMAEELGDPKGQLIFLFSTGRCGSTLLLQMIQTTGKCISISEPDSTSSLALWYKNKGDSPQLRQLCRDVVRWTCRPYKNFTPMAYMLKIMPLYTYALPIFRDTYPQSKCLFMYRNVIKVAQSIYRISRGSPILIMASALGKLSAMFTEGCFDYVGYLGKEFRYRLRDDLSLGVVMAAVNCKLYVEFRLNGHAVSAVRYEDIMEDKHFAAREILKFCDLPISFEEDFLRGLESDSQPNSVVTRKMASAHVDPPLTPELERLANLNLKKNNLPIIGDDWLLEGTITKNDRHSKTQPNGIRG